MSRFSYHDHRTPNRRRGPQLRVQPNCATRPRAAVYCWVRYAALPESFSRRWSCASRRRLCAAIGCDGGARMPDAQTQPAAYSAELSVRFEVSPACRHDGLGAGLPRRRRRARDRRARPGQSAGRRGARSGMRAARRRPREPRARRCAAARSISRSSAASASAWARPDAADVIRTLPARLPGRRRRRRRRGRRSGAAARRRGFPNTSASSPPTPSSPVAELAVPALPEAARGQRSGARRRPAGRRQRRADAVARRAGGALVELRPFGATVAVSCAVPTNALDRGAGHRPARAARPPAAPRRNRRAGTQHPGVDRARAPGPRA